MKISLLDSGQFEIGDTVNYNDGSFVGSGIIFEIEEVYKLSHEKIEELKLKSSTAWFYPSLKKVIAYSDESNNNRNIATLNESVIQSEELVNRFFWIEGFPGGHSVPYYYLYKK